MFEIIGMLVVGVLVVAIAIALLVLVVKIALVLLPIALVIGAICLVVFFCDGGHDIGSYIDSYRQPKTEKVERRVVRFRDPVQRDFHEEAVSLIRQKAGVNLSTIRPEIDSAISVVVWVYRMFAEDDDFMPLLTSADDYEGHAPRSAHYAGAAIDFRIKDMGSMDDRRELAKKVRDELGERFFVLHEDIGTSNEHLHVQLKNGSYDRSVVWK